VTKEGKKRKILVQKELFSEKRELVPEEYSALREKQKKGYLNADFFRSNMFNATTRGKRVEYKNPKKIYEDKNKNIYISHPLHQRHADVLSLIHSDCDMVTKPNEDGSYSILISLYKIAKLMGYENPNSDNSKVKKFINDLRGTDFIEQDKSIPSLKRGYKILGDYILDENTEKFFITVSGKSAKVLAYATGIKFEREIAHKIVKTKPPKVKAIVRYMLSNRTSDKGVTVNWFLERFDITTSDKQSKFRGELKKNIDVLAEFGITYNLEEKKLYYKKQLPEVSFSLPLNKKRVLSKIMNEDEQGRDQNTEPTDTDKYNDLIGKKFKINDEIFQVIEIKENSDDNTKINIFIYNESVNKRGWLKINLFDFIKLIEKYD